MLKLSAACIAALILLQSPASFAQAAPASAVASAMDAAARAQVIDALVTQLDAYYVFPDVAASIGKALRDKQQRGGYDGAVRPQDFAAVLTADLREFGHDLHLGVRFSEAPQPPLPDATDHPSPADEARIVARVKELKYGIGTVEKLPGNIGYLEMRGFAPIKYVDHAITAAMTQLADSDALIIDMRGNGGGDPAGVAFLTSYLFDKRTHLNDLYWREGNRTQEFWTTEVMPGKKYGQQKPVYVLTSPRTFSGGEEFSYNLQQLKRATLIGETTGGGANPGAGRQLNPHFTVFVPSGRAINPITKTNWEHTGVVPHVKVAASDALVTAQKMALEQLASAATDPQRAASLRARGAELDRQPASPPQRKGSN
ncbi:MAG TPA: S41 family peptidase [Telluria sp.]|nr:S41 family peptidase [Telluria sp.]